MFAFFDQATWAIGAAGAASAASVGKQAKTLLSARALVARVRVSCLMGLVFL
jgi:hypothetical protein